MKKIKWVLPCPFCDHLTVFRDGGMYCDNPSCDKYMACIVTSTDGKIEVSDD